MKKLVILFFAFGMLINLFSQVPSYVPTKGLVGWWPFNGDAKDESGSGNNGTANGANLTTDRFGLSNSAYQFDGLNDFISTNYSGISGTQNRTIQFWAKHNQSFDAQKCASCSRMPAISYGSNVTGPSEIGKGVYCDFNAGATGVGFDGNETYATFDAVNKVNDNKWHHYVYVFETISNVTSIKIYQDSQLLKKILYTYLGNSSINTKLQVPLQFGIRTYNSVSHPSNFYKGELDDIGFWNRALDSNEIKRLFKGCSKIATQPVDASASSSKTATFNAKHSDSTFTSTWQSKHVDLPWINLNANSTYSLKTNSLTVKNLSVSNHNQKFRVIYKNQNCIDTSSIATLYISDTCIYSVYDTISVQDTLLINAKLTGTSPLQTNLIKVYPNPVKDYLIIDFGNYMSLAGYEITIFDAVGKSVYSSSINKQLESLDINKWSGKGIYYLRIFDKQGNRIENRKIVIQ